MQLLNRRLNVYIVQNLGTTSSTTTSDPVTGVDLTIEQVATQFGYVYDIADNVIEISDVGFEVDANITVSGMTTCSLKVLDTPDNRIWTFIQSCLSSPPNPTINPIYPGGVLPPWIIVTLDDIWHYYGVIDTASLQRVNTDKDWYINISTQDWYQMASKAPIPSGFWTRDLPVVTTSRTASSPTQGFSAGAGTLNTAYANGIAGVINKVYFTAVPGWFIVGDQFTSDHTGTNVYTCTGIGSETLNGHPCQYALLQGFAWPNPTGPYGWFMVGAAYVWNFTRIASDLTVTEGYSVTIAATKSTTAAPVLAINLNTVDNLVPGDVLVLTADTARPDGATLTINDIDAQEQKIILSEALSVDLIVGDLLNLDATSEATMVFTPFKQVVNQAVSSLCYSGLNANSPTGASVDFSLFEPATLPQPALSWLALRDNGSSNSIIHTPYDLQPTLTDIQLHAIGAAWEGNPGLPTNGWLPTWTSCTWTDTVDWTQQLPLTSPPAMLMPYPAFDNGSRRNRTNHNATRDSQTQQDKDAGDDTDAPLTVLACDYPGMRAFVASRPLGSSSNTITTSTWSGTAWSTPVNHAWTGDPIISAAPLPSMTTSLGTGSALLVLSKNATTKYGTLTVMFNTTTTLTTIIALNFDVTGYRLVQTPFGVWLVGSQSWAKYEWVAGFGLAKAFSTSLYNISVAITGLGLLNNTFIQYDAINIYCMAGNTYMDGTATKSETYMFQLQADTDSSLNSSVINMEKLCDGIPRITIMTLDPSLPGRLIGLCGARFFQISNRMSAVLEKYTGDGLTVADLITNVCLLQNAVAVPNAAGVLQIVSRSQSKTTTYDEIPVGIVTRTQTRVSDRFFSQVNVSGNDTSTAGWAFGQIGGLLLEVSGHPFISTASESRAVALALANFFGQPRNMEEHTWVWLQDGNPVWETLKPMQLVRVNQEETLWYVLKCNHSLDKPQCTVTLLDSLYTVSDGDLVAPTYPGDTSKSLSINKTNLLTKPIDVGSSPYEGTSITPNEDATPTSTYSLQTYATYTLGSYASTGLTMDTAGNTYITANGGIYKCVPPSTVTSLGGGNSGVTIDSLGHLLTLQQTQVGSVVYWQIMNISGTAFSSAPVTGTPLALASDTSGNVYTLWMDNDYSGTTYVSKTTQDGTTTLIITSTLGFNTLFVGGPSQHLYATGTMDSSYTTSGVYEYDQSGTLISNTQLTSPPNYINSLAVMADGSYWLFTVDNDTNVNTATLYDASRTMVTSFVTPTSASAVVVRAGVVYMWSQASNLVSTLVS